MGEGGGDGGRELDVGVTFFNEGLINGSNLKSTENEPVFLLWLQLTDRIRLSRKDNFSPYQSSFIRHYLFTHI